MTPEQERKRLADLIEVAVVARDNLISLVNAYPDSYPRHAFQGTIDRLIEVVGSPADMPTFAHTPRED